MPEPAAATKSEYAPERPLMYHTPNELAALVEDNGIGWRYALEELRLRALHAPFPLRRESVG